MTIVNNELMAADTRDLVKGVLNIPEGVTLINKNVIKGNFSIKKIIIPKSVKYIGDMFALSSYALEEVVMPEEMNYVGWCFLCDCKNLKKITIY
jgi:hypothetical protein